MIILDTNVVSELMRETPHPGVVAWVRGHVTQGLVTTAVTIAEIGYGVERLPPGRRRDMLRSAARSQFEGFGSQILAFDVAAALKYPEVVVARELAGRPTTELDAQIAAIALSSGSAVATRNARDFTGVGLEILDPWAAA